MTAPREPTPIPVRCPECGKRLEANASPGSVLKWECKRCGKVVEMVVPKKDAA